MKLRVQNQLNMVGSCITVANEPETKAVWHGQPPAAFGTDLAALATAHAAVSATHALAMTATGGAADAKAVAEATLEDLTYAIFGVNLWGQAPQ